MTNSNSSPVPASGHELVCGDVRYRIIDLPALFGPSLASLPVVLRLLLENLLRNTVGRERDDAVAAIRAWLDTGTSEAEIAFQPSRVLMHDTTSTPALVDIAAMRNTLQEAGVDPAILNPGLPVDVSVDHSLAVEFFARPDAPENNLKLELHRNRERYSFLQWASKVLRGVRIHPPGTGIMHTINLEQLATVVTTQERDGQTWAMPDTLIGTDSHTPMINGIGVLGWGVGGLEAQTVMFGMPTMLRIPDVIGVELTGVLSPGALATDLALTVTQRLRAIGVSGEFVEFFGPGVCGLSANERAVVANMAPEYGATTGFFPVDEKTLDYLRATSRSEARIALAEAYLRRTGLWFDPAARPRFTRSIRIDLGGIGMHVAGPRRPQDLLAFTDTREALAKAAGTARAVNEAKSMAPPAGGGQPGDSAGDAAGAVAAVAIMPVADRVVDETGVTAAAAQPVLPYHPVAIAAITSCTNTSDPALLVAAGLVARKARAFGLKVPSWVKTSLGPGSPAAASYLERAGLVDDLSAVGFDIVGYGCTTCIGNSGPLTQPIQRALAEKRIHPVAMLSGNRNFPGRVHPDLDLGFLMSPPLVIVFALAGDAEIDLATEPVQRGADGRAVHLRDLWPSHEEVAAAVALGAKPQDYPRAFAIASRNPMWHALASPDTALYPWDPASTALRRPPFAAITEGSLLGSYVAQPLMVVGDDITTDHISPASAIPRDSFVADFLVERGDDRDDLNVFASRRGNWEVMMRAAFYSKSLVNLLAPASPVGHTLHVPSGDIMPIHLAAQRYREAGEPVVLLAGERYGTGSSRDWAAKGQRLLGIRAVIAVSFERIHRSNLIGMGILPLRFPAGVSPASLAIAAGDRIEIDAPAGLIHPRAPIGVRILRRDGAIDVLQATAAVETQLETELLRDGGVIPSILQKTIASHAPRDRPARKQ